MIVNLNKYKKQRERAEDERRAAENRVRFGRSKAARTKTSANMSRPKNPSKTNASTKRHRISAR